jgi:diacylglycerol kinase (ATP)
VDPGLQPDLGTTDFLLANPAAGGGRAADALRPLREFARQQNWSVQICCAASAEDLAARARDAAGQGYRRLFVLGGDGTFQALLNAVSDYPDAILGIIPAGSGNDLAASLGLPNHPLRAAALLLDGQPCRMDAVRVRTADGRERLYTGGGGVGLDAEAARYANGAFRHLRGRLRYLLSAIRALVGFHPLRVRVSFRGEPGELQNVTATALLVGVLNTPSYGAGLYLAPDAKTDDGTLDVVILEDLNAFEVLALLPSLWSTGHLRSTRVQRFRASCIRIETETTCRFHGDGELIGETPVEISVLPQAFSIVRPVSYRPRS